MKKMIHDQFIQEPRQESRKRSGSTVGMDPGDLPWMEPAYRRCRPGVGPAASEVTDLRPAWLHLHAELHKLNELHGRQ
jgi:hypothetical protein